VEKALFSVSCTTCRAKLAVRNKSALGQILECPKCGSMVMISPPDGWVDEQVSPPAAAPQPAPEQNGVVIPKSGKSGILRKVTAPTKEPGGETASEKPAVVPPPVQVSASEKQASETTPDDAADEKTAVAAPPIHIAAGTLPSSTPPTPTEGPQAIAVRMGFTPFTVPEAVAGETYLSALSQSFWGRVVVLLVSGLLGLGGVLAIWKLAVSRPATPVAKTADRSGRTGDAQTDPTPAPPDAAAPRTSPEQINRRWLPEQSVYLLDIRPSRLARQKAGYPVVNLLSRWQPCVQLLLMALNLQPEQVRRLTWAATDLGDASKNCVVVIELEDGVDPARYVPKGNEVNLGGAIVGHSQQNGGWPFPLATADAHTIVTGNEELLRRVAGRGGDSELSSGAMELLLKKLVPAGDLTVMVDLSAARAASWKPPADWLDLWPEGKWKPLADWLDVWPEGKSSWRLLCETPLALGFSVQTADEHRCELGLVCPSETGAETLHLEMEKLAKASIHVLPEHIAALKSGAAANKSSAVVSDQYRGVLDELLASLRTSHSDSSDGILWLRLGWSGDGLPGWIAKVFDNAATVRADWLAAAREADEANQRGLLKGLLGCVKSENPPRFPEAARGALALRPETRLSWIADLLPFLGHDDWHLNSAYDWNGAANQSVAQRPLPEVVNPALGPAKTAAGYPVTHYVGAAGVGEDAAHLPAGAPRAGVFGYGRQTRQQDLVRGGANTIAILGVQDQCGPWAQGGRATVRAFTQQPYVNGPDGFGSGQAEGMVVGMADGSVRFISKDIDPHTLEQLVTVRDGDKVDMASLDPRPAPPPEPFAPAKPPLVAGKPAAVVAKPQAAALDPRLKSRLAEPVQKISLPNMPLGKAVHTVEMMGAISVSFDPDAMEELGVSLHDPVTIDTSDATVATLLDKIAAARNMVQVVENGQILLTSTVEQRQHLRSMRYTVSDLTRGDVQVAVALAALVQRFVAPESWQVAGGQGSIEVAADTLQITQTGHVHYQIIVFCEKLRVARGLPTKSRLDPRKFTLETRTARARPILGHITSLNFGATPLCDVLQQFKQPAGAEILIDRPALAAAGIPDNVPAKLRSENLPQGIVLRQLLDPLGLAWRAVDAETLQITTKDALASRLEVEFYPVSKRLAGQPPADLIEKVKAGVQGAVWGNGGATGAIDFDPASQCLIVLQPQPLQQAIEAFLAQTKQAAPAMPAIERIKN